MRVNTAKSLELGDRIHEEFGSWAKAREAAKLRDGVYVLPAKKDAGSEKKREPAKSE